MDRLETDMTKATKEVLKNLERSNYISALLPQESYAERGWGSVELDNYRFPWDRAFEISMDIRVGAPTAPHKSFLGIYYS